MYIENALDWPKKQVAGTVTLTWFERNFKDRPRTFRMQVHDLTNHATWPVLDTRNTLLALDKAAAAAAAASPA